ncbi:excinuclease ABC subunit UvrB [Patescibacteria group bacterium]|nr:excinuclease ABC subunit UvrB [Patescibacteria group bacterium]
MNRFTLNAPFQPAGDQPEAIARLLANISKGMEEQVLLGVTGSGKTYTMAEVIAALNRPTLIISHNKTLAAQLYQEFRDFFPKNAVSYFVSYYDYYQPEAYIPQSDTYIEKETEINEEIDKLRLAATTNLLTRPDTIVVASVSCIYNIGSPKEYGHFVLELKPGMKVDRTSVFKRLVDLQYERTEYGFTRGTFRVRGETVDLFPAYEDSALRLTLNGEYLRSIERMDPLTGNRIDILPATVIYPAKHYMTDPKTYTDVFALIRSDLEASVRRFQENGKYIEAQRIGERVNFDLEMIREMGYVNGIENYSRYFDGRTPGDPPYTLLDYFSEAAGRDWLLFIDESHMTVPQIRGMYNGDRARKQTLIDYGFRLPAALDNRPLRFEEFLRRIPQTVYVSATPDEWEIGRARESASRISPDGGGGGITEQLVRPTGLLDPIVELRPSKGQIDDLTAEIETHAGRHERVLVTTLTKRMAEDLAAYLEEKGIRVHYLHSDVETLMRTDILADLRSGTYDVIVGINLLREGLDLPEVSLVAILDADKEGFLRSRTSLIQTMGRAARHRNGRVIMYADHVTRSMQDAIDEGKRRRLVQETFNREHGLEPHSIVKPIRKKLVEYETKEQEDIGHMLSEPGAVETLTPGDRKQRAAELTRAMRRAARDLDFESAARLRDLIETLR